MGREKKLYLELKNSPNYFHFMKRHKNDEPLVEAVGPRGLYI